MNAPQTPDVDRAALSAAAQQEIHPFIGAAVRPSDSTTLFHRIDPADGAARGSYACSSANDVDHAVAAARVAVDTGEWSRAGPQERRGCLLRFAENIERDAQAIALADCLDVGKPISSALVEAGIAAGFIRYYAEAIDKHYGAIAPTGAGALELQLWRPRGVVGAITPWNFPAINVALKAGPALAAGNSLVIKPSELSPTSTLRLAALAVESGIPPGVINVVPGDGKTGEALARHGGVDLITFTGSTQTGKAVLRSIGESRIAPALLECGGKSPEIVFADMESQIEEIAAAILANAMWNQGQVCVTRSRLFIEEVIHDRLLEALHAGAAQVRAGHPLEASTSFGPLASPRQKERVEGYIAQGIAEGARLLLDGRNPPDCPPGCYVGPTLFDRVDRAARIAREEIFGPVIAVFRFKDEAEALALANNTDYGLAATVWTQDLGRAHRMGMSLRAGKVKVMSTPAAGPGPGFAQSCEPVAQSGYGVEGGMRGLESYMRLQSLELGWRI